jgi:hypothetical protein
MHAVNIRVYRHGKYKLVILAIEVVEVVAPDVLDVLSGHPSMGVGRVLGEHHWREICRVIHSVDSLFHTWLQSCDLFVFRGR